MTYDIYATSAVFSPDGKYVVSGGCDRMDANNQFCLQSTEHVWLYHPEDLIVNACPRVMRNLTRAEWIQYIGDMLPYQAVCPKLPIEPEP